MFRNAIKLFKIFGFEVKIDFSWIIIAALVTWSLAGNLFPAFYKDYSTATYIWMGVAGALGLFISIILHELSHSLIARRHGLNMRGITLFIFGGVAEMPDEPRSPKAEFYMAVAGPAASVVIGGVFFGLSYLGQINNVSQPITGVLSYLALINIILAGFNLIPAYPLDGGRILRSALWSWKKNLQKATKISSEIGSFFGLLMIVFGLIRLFSGYFIGGLWIGLIGLFLRSASQRGYEQVLIRKALQGEPVRKFMVENPVTVPGGINISRFVEDHAYKYHHKIYPVVNDSSLDGCLTIKQIKDIPREKWETETVADIAQSCSDDITIDVNADALEALRKMNRTGNTRLIVTKNNSLAGIITLKDMLGYLSLKLDLEHQV